VHELILRIKSRRTGNKRLLVSTSFSGGKIPSDNVISVSDFILVHGNGVERPERIEEMVKTIRKNAHYRGQPILFNEDDHFDFDKPDNNMIRAIKSGASWGYFDPGKNNYMDGYQCPPVNWGLNTKRKIEFFGLVKQITQN
ncbi:MAG TPA: hypothetical protein GXX14_13180, partial [Clostridiaceae bacterium]|nr:hypothetical protein [Clostridiaceae bacterium]